MPNQHHQLSPPISVSDFSSIYFCSYLSIPILASYLAMILVDKRIRYIAVSHSHLEPQLRVHREPLHDPWLKTPGIADVEPVRSAQEFCQAEQGSAYTW
jgi:hypothetical protein